MTGSQQHFKTNSLSYNSVLLLNCEQQHKSNLLDTSQVALACQTFTKANYIPTDLGQEITERQASTASSTFP